MYEGEERRRQPQGEYTGEERRKAGPAGVEESQEAAQPDEMATDQEPEPGPEQAQH